MCRQHAAVAAVVLAMFLCRICSAEQRQAGSPHALDLCNATADGRDLVCRGAGLLSILDPLDPAVLASAANLTKM